MNRDEQVELVTPRTMLISTHAAVAMVVMAIVEDQFGWSWVASVVGTLLAGALDVVVMCNVPDGWLPSWAQRGWHQ